MSAGRIAMLFAVAALVGSGCGGGDKPKGQPLEAAHGTVRQADFGRRAVRVRGLSPMDVAGAAVLAAYPGQDLQPNGIVLPRLDRWQEVLLAAQFSAAPVSAAVLPRKRDYLPTATADLVDRMNLRGFPKASGLQAVVMGQAGDEIFVALQQKNLKLTQLKARSPAKLSFDVIPFRGGWAAAYSDQIVVVSSEQRDQALPGAAWSAYSGDTLAYAGRDSIPAETRALLVQRKKLRLDSPHVYVIGPPSAISTGVEAQLRAYGPVTRIGGPSASDTAIALARFHDATNGFGWGLRGGPASFSFVNPRDWGNAIGAFAFAGAGPQAPLLLTGRDGSLSPALRAYLRDVRSPSGSQGFVLGDERSIPTSTLTEIDGLLAPGPAPHRAARPTAGAALPGAAGTTAPSSAAGARTVPAPAALGGGTSAR